MLDYLAQYGVFLLEVVTIVIAIFALIAGVIAITTKGKIKEKNKIKIKKLNKQYEETAHTMKEAVLPKQKYKGVLKAEKKAKKAAKKSKTAESEQRARKFIIKFEGDIKASAVNHLREEISAILAVANTDDEVVLLLESAGGMVHSYGLAASQLERIRQRNIPLTVIVDKVAASGGYLMACVAHKILAAPFAIIGSIGVIAQIPNFHRLLKEKHIDFEQITAGEFKRTLTILGENTDKARAKLKKDIEDIHQQFKDFIVQNRANLDIEKIATGEHWLGSKALELSLVDQLITSDDYLQTVSKDADLYQVNYLLKKSVGEKLAHMVQLCLEKAFMMVARPTQVEDQIR